AQHLDRLGLAAVRGVVHDADGAALGRLGRRIGLVVGGLGRVAGLRRAVGTVVGRAVVGRAVGGLGRRRRVARHCRLVGQGGRRAPRARCRGIARRLGRLGIGRLAVIGRLVELGLVRLLGDLAVGAVVAIVVVGVLGGLALALGGARLGEQRLAVGDRDPVVV